MIVKIISPRHVSYNPRVVKEADALSDAGHDVTVVALCNHERQAVLDQGVVRERPWRLVTVSCRRRGGGAVESTRWLWQTLRQRLAQRVCTKWRSPWWIERAQGRETPELARLAGRTPADLYIAHHAEALPAAAAAARRHRARLAFDAEDFHSGMDNRRVPETVWRGAGNLEESVRAILDWHATLPKLPEQRRIEYLESTCLPQCSYVTAASPGIAMALEVKYGIPRPTVIRNSFPPGPSLPPPRPSSAVGCSPSSFRLYWFSQVIGPGRGMEEAVDALALLPESVELHLRGDVANGFGESLKGRAEGTGVWERVTIHPPCPPRDLVRESSRFDVGLALETGVDMNRLICETNKVFVYSLAGLPVVASDTPAQTHLAGLAAGVELCRSGCSESLAQAVAELLPLRGAGRTACSSPNKRPWDWHGEMHRLRAVVATIWESAG